jgi:hypothetical protein
VVHVAAGASDGFAVTSSGQLYSFGANTFGELGNAKNLLTFTPNPEPGLVTLPGEIGPAIQVASGLDHTLVLTASGQLYSFGENVAGQLGYEQNSGTEEPNQVPEPVSLPGASGPVVQIAAGGLHSLALTASGQLYSFGYNRYGQLGRPANSGTSEPTPLPGLVALPGATGRVVQIAAGENSSLALTASGQLFSFGENTFGQLGIATSDSEPHPVPALVALPAGATADTVARGSTALHALAIVADLAVVGTPLPTGAVGSPYRAGVQAVGGAPPYDWTAAGLPPGLSIDTASGVISGIPTAAGSYTATLTVADSDGIEALAPFLIPISAPQTLAIEGPPTLLPTPTISSARESARRWREGSALARISRANSISARSKRPPTGARFSFSLNEQASVHFSFTRPVSGRKVGRECVAKTHANGRRKVCTLTVTAATLSFAGHAGANTVSFQGRISRSERLDPGYYTLIIVATDSAGARSAPASLSFTIVR